MGHHSPKEKEGVTIPDMVFNDDQTIKKQAAAARAAAEEEKKAREERDRKTKLANTERRVEAVRRDLANKKTIRTGLEQDVRAMEQKIVEGERAVSSHKGKQTVGGHVSELKRKKAGLKQKEEEEKRKLAKGKNSKIITEQKVRDEKKKVATLEEELRKEKQTLLSLERDLQAVGSGMQDEISVRQVVAEETHIEEEIRETEAKERQAAIQAGREKTEIDHLRSLLIQKKNDLAKAVREQTLAERELATLENAVRGLK